MKNLETVFTDWTILTLAFIAAAIATLHPLSAQALSPSELLDRMNTSALILPVENVIPSSALEFDAGVVLGQQGPEIAGLVGEAFAEPTPVPNGSIASSANYEYLLHPDVSRFLLVVSEDGMPVSIPQETTPEQDTRAKLAQLGIHGGELGTIEHHNLMAQEMNDQGELGVAEIFAHKVFVRRSIGGVNLLDSHIVTSYTPDSRFKKMIGRWPGLASEGHSLNTSISVDEAKLLVLDRLVAEGDTDPVADIVVDSVYEERPELNGRVALALMLRATVHTEPLGLADGDGAWGEKARRYLVSPVPEPAFATSLALGVAILVGVGVRRC
ncbi:MAG: hypothetical protein CMJ98_07270 [Planctomycetes bacterium]|nr:hypothetical protein [Planctomycetota bacterium]